MIRAFGDRILVRIIEKEKKKSIVIVPEERKEYQIGQVVAVGPESEWEKGDGDFVLLIGYYVYTRKYAGLLIEYDGIEYVSLESKEILAFSEELK